MKVLLLHPDFREPGGVASYYSKIDKLYTQSVDHFIVGSRPGEMGRYRKIFRILEDYRLFVEKIKKGDYDVIHVNPSLDSRSFLRDGIFILLARIYKKKIIVFIHGWHESYEKVIRKHGMWLFKYVYGKVNAFIVLAEAFKMKLVSWGCRQPIYLEVIVIEDSILRNIDINIILENRSKSRIWRVLFLSRIIREKGIYETIDAFSLLGEKYPQIELIIAGDGKELENVKSVVQKRDLKNVFFTGYINGEEKNKVLENSHILIFPTYSEGFPNTIVEAMSFGLPIVTRPVGGIADFFKNGKHGFATNSKNPVDLADYMEKLLLEIDLYRQISLFNHEYAKLNFLASHAVRRLEKIYESISME